jgi:hypothetical protein
VAEEAADEATKPEETAETIAYQDAATDMTTEEPSGDDEDEVADTDIDTESE